MGLQRKKSKGLIFIILVGLGVMVDQLIKTVVVMKEIGVVINRGVAWGLGENISWISISLGLLVLVLLRFRMGFFTGLIIGGGMSNLVDRIRWGGVVDFLSFFQTFEFNLADIVIILGVGGLIFKEIYGSKSNL